MKIGAPELLARKALLNDAKAEDDARDARHVDPLFEATLARLRQAQTTAHTGGDADAGLTSEDHEGMRRRRDNAVQALDADGLSEDQVLSATANNPVLAALAAARGPWQTMYGSGVGAAPASSDRHSAVMLTAQASKNPAITSTEGRSAAPTRSDVNTETMHVDGLGLTAQPLDAAAETALIAAQNTTDPSSATTTVVAPQAAAPGANVPTLPLPTAQRLVDGTVAALRIDRDTANPNHSTSFIEVRHPELGVVRVEVQLRGDAMELRFEAGVVATALLRASESVLRKAVGQHGLRLRNLQIDSRSTPMQERSRRARRHLLDLEA